MNILFITSDQQRADCYGFEGRKVKTPHLDMLAREGTRFSACITPNLVCQPSRASILTGLLPGTHGVWDNGVDLPDATGEAASPAASPAGYAPASSARRISRPRNTFAPTGTPECRASPQPQDWFGPYMGFQHVELMVEGHNTTRPLDAALAPALRALVLRRRPRRGEEPAADGASCAPVDRRRADLALGAAGRVAQLDLDRRSHDRVPARQQGPAVLRLGVVPRSASSVRLPRAVEPPARPDDVDLPEHRTLDLERRPWWHKASLDGTPKMENSELRKFRAKARACRTRPTAAARADRQLLRHDLADRPQRRPHPDRARHLWASPRTRWSSTPPTTATGSAITA